MKHLKTVKESFKLYTLFSQTEQLCSGLLSYEKFTSFLNKKLIKTSKRIELLINKNLPTKMCVNF